MVAVSMEETMSHLPTAVRLAVLGVLPLAGCTAPCGGDHENFELHTGLSVDDVARLLEDYSVAALDELTCEEVCDYAVAMQGRYVAELADCTVTTEGEGAHVDCSGASGYYCEGRRPLGHVEPELRAPDPVAATLAAWAHLEAAAVVAFHQLVERLVALGAPADLIARCRTAQRDELRHARILGAFAERAGAAVPPVVVEEGPDSLLDLALHNAGEAVLETFAALVNRWQGANLADAGLRLAMASIARDELEHAELAWDLHGWLRERLSAGEQAQLDAHVDEMLAGLPDRAARTAAAAPAGLHPGIDEARALAEGLASRLAA